MATKTATRPTEGNGKPGQKSENPGVWVAPGFSANEKREPTEGFLNVFVIPQSSIKTPFCQAIKLMLLFIAAIVTSTKYTTWKSCLLDRLLCLVEGGGDDL